MTGRFVLRVSSSEVAGPGGKWSQAERAARNPRPDSGIRLKAPVVTPPEQPRGGDQ